MTNHIMRAILIFASRVLITLLAVSASSFAKPPTNTGSLVRVKDPESLSRLQSSLQNRQNWTSEALTENWLLIKGPKFEQVKAHLQGLAMASDIEYIQPDYPIQLLHDYRLQDPLRRAAIQRSSKSLREVLNLAMPADNPPLPTNFSTGQGADPDLGRQWGMLDISAAEAWRMSAPNKKIIVAVIDTGVDYTHDDLRPNLWRNPNEIPGNNLDDDKNGYVDDIIGWDFVSDDNKPFDFAVDPLKLISTGGNPGHGTHCAGNVAARGGNGIGISGVSPHTEIMSLRFLSESGGGTTSGAIRAIRYAVDKGAHILSNSWGSEGEDPQAGEENRALREVITYAESKDVIFVAAAGNGHKGKGYDNDNDPRPGYPASYPNDNIISVTAIDVNDQLGGFANWGVRSVDIAAPGLNVYSTTVGNKYSDKVIDLASISVDWDGTSMATPHVAGALALYWSTYPQKTWREVKEALMTSARPVSQLQGKILTGGKLNVGELMKK